MLQGLIAGLIVCLLLLFSIVKYRKYALYLLLVTVIIVFIEQSLMYYEQQRERYTDAKRETQHIQLINEKLTVSHGNYYAFSAVLSNLSSQFKLREIILQIDFLNCQHHPCQVIESQRVTIRAYLDRGMSKKIKANVARSTLAQPLQQEEWQYTIVDIDLR